MQAYIVRRLLLMIPILFLTTIIVFLLMRVLPGDLIDSMMASSQLDVELDRDAMERYLGLDVPRPIQYGRWVGVLPQTDGSFSGLLQGDLGISWWTRLSVVDLLSTKWPVTLELGLLALIVAQLIALPIGILSALRQDKWGDYLGRSFAILCISVPGFWVATLIIVFPAIWWGYSPPIMHIPFAEDPIGNLKMFIVPAIVLGMGMAGMTMRMTRTMMLEVLRQDYIRTAWAKGLKEGVVVTRHGLKNALIPVVTLIGMQIPVMIGGSVIIEQVFSLPGIGRLMVDAVFNRDYGLISGILFLFAVGLVFINLAVDLTYAFLDPRIHYE